MPQAYDGQNRGRAPRFTVLRKKDHSDSRDFHSEFAKYLYRTLVPGAHIIMDRGVLFHILFQPPTMLRVLSAAAKSFEWLRHSAAVTGQRELT